MAYMMLPEFSDVCTLGVVIATVTSVLLAALVTRNKASKRPWEGSTGQAYVDRDFVTHADLVDPEIRGNHLAFNAHLHARFAGQRFLPVRGEDGCFIAFAHAICKDAMNDGSTFSSNPFPDGRLVALNTMSKADHSRVLRYVHSHYTQLGVANLEDRIRAVIERCTDELEDGSGGDVVTWAKRVHMASTLARLGVDWDPTCNTGGPASWNRVDEVIALNDAMVALVAPLGGVGKQYSTLPHGQFLRVLLGLIRSLPPTLLMFLRLGFSCAWEIIRPDVTVLWPPRQPRMGLWWHPELLPLVPRYFLALHKLLTHQSAAEGPLEGIRKGVESGDLKLAEALTLLVQLMVNMTSANALANLVYRLGSEKAAAEEVAADPDRLAAAFVQEVLRLDAPLQRNPRRVARPVAGKWADCPLQEGNQVLLFLGAANMDPTVFEDPDKFRLGRETVPLSFGSGMHYCLGSNLVKLEMRAALECLLRRFSSVEVVSSYQRLVDVDVGNWGFRRLEVRLRRKSA
mmetsp:Transcript_65545/g.166066  ORF Transcript_65545/g.166066 Transcript_65545/m.166066 type:complete len:514 (+) Transcript_65545:79-1620(+)